MSGADERLRAPMLAAIVATLLIALAGLAAAALPVKQVAVGQQAIPEHRQEMHLTDSTRQRRAYLALLLSAAVLVAVARRDRVRAGVLRWAQPRTETAAPAVRAVALALPVVILFLCRERSATYLASVALVAGLVWFGRRTTWRRADVVVAAAVIPYFFLLFVPGFLFPLDPTIAGVPAGIAEAHYGAVVSQGDRLARGLRLFTDVMPQYGLVVPEFLGLTEAARGLLSFGAHARLVQVAQVLFALAAVSAYLIWSRGRVLEAALAFVPVLAMIHTLHASVFCPNQSGLRFLGIPLGVLCLLSVRRRERAPAFLLGLAGGALIAFNPETGFALVAGYVVYLLSAAVGSPDGQSRRGTLFRLGAGLAVVPLLLGVVFWIGYGYPPAPMGGSRGYALLKFSGGYGGLPLYFGIGWIVVLTHALYELASGFFRSTAPSSRRRVRMALAATIVLWFAYFFNRPDEWNLWTVYFLYGFFIIDLVSPARRRLYVRLLKQRRLALGWAIVAMFVAIQARNVTNALRTNLSVVRHRTAAFAPATLSDLRFTADYADAAARRAQLVKDEAAAGRDFYYFSGNIYLVPLMSGVFQPFGDPYEVYSNDDFDRTVERLRASGPPELLFDDARQGFAGSVERNHYYARLKDRLLGVYRLQKLEAGWEIWRRGPQT
ncbi:MAG TPA: hypothetical protein VKZ18_01250 [Polyangia bacterium]|nr:hypothetical protein [Polyangia bacterium]